MAVLAAITLWRSVAHASLFLAMMSGVDGFSAPMALQTGVMNTGGLFTFLGFIAIMMLGTVIGLRKWYSLYVVALGARLLWWFMWSLVDIGTISTSIQQQQIPSLQTLCCSLLRSLQSKCELRFYEIAST